MPKIKLNKSYRDIASGTIYEEDDIKAAELVGLGVAEYISEDKMMKPKRKGGRRKKTGFSTK